MEEQRESTAFRERESFAEQLNNFEILEALIEKKLDKYLKSRAPEPYESEKTELLATALSKAQGEFPRITTNRANNYLFNQYSDLDMIMRSVRKALADNGLSVTQHTRLDNDKVALVTRLRHKSSQFIETRSRIIPSRNDLQTYISALKAMKRHDIMCLLNITILDDLDDDDGEHDMSKVREERNKGTGLNVRYKAREESIETISQDQVNEIERVIGDYIDLHEEVLEKLKIHTLADMPKSKYWGVKDQLSLNVAARDGKIKNV